MDEGQRMLAFGGYCVGPLACGESAGSAAAFLGLTWRAMGRTTATVTYVDAYARQTQAAALHADGQHGDQQ